MNRRFNLGWRRRHNVACRDLVHVPRGEGHSVQPAFDGDTQSRLDPGDAAPRAAVTALGFEGLDQRVPGSQGTSGGFSRRPVDAPPRHPNGIGAPQRARFCTYVHGPDIAAAHAYRQVHVGARERCSRWSFFERSRWRVAAGEDDKAEHCSGPPHFAAHPAWSRLAWSCIHTVMMPRRRKDPPRCSPLGLPHRLSSRASPLFSLCGRQVALHRRAGLGSSCSLRTTRHPGLI